MPYNQPDNDVKRTKHRVFSAMAFTSTFRQRSDICRISAVEYRPNKLMEWFTLSAIKFRDMQVCTITHD